MKKNKQKKRKTGLIHYLYYKWIDRRFPYHLFTEEKFGKPEGTFYKLSVAWCKYWIEWPTIGVYKVNEQ